jgi:hypothetical protein
LDLPREETQYDHQEPVLNIKMNTTKIHQNPKFPEPNLCISPAAMPSRLSVILTIVGSKHEFHTDFY